jgi:hypothetical protein
MAVILSLSSRINEPIPLVIFLCSISNQSDIAGGWVAVNLQVCKWRMPS